MMRYSVKLALSVAGLGLAAAVHSTPVAAAECEVHRPVVFADLNYGSAQFHTAVASYIIANGFGCEVDSIPGDIIPLVNGVARGDADIIMELYTANPGQALIDAEGGGQLVALGTTYADAVQVGSSRPRSCPGPTRWRRI